MGKIPILLLAAGGLALAGCSERAPGSTYTIPHPLPFEGEAYPDQREPIPTPPGGLGLVTDRGSDTLSFIDLTTGEGLGSALLGRDPVGNDGPVRVVVDAAAGAVFVAFAYPATAGTGPHADHAAGPELGWVQKLALDDLRLIGETAVDRGPSDLALSDDGARLAMTHFNLEAVTESPDAPETWRASLYVFDPAGFDPPSSPEATQIPTCLAASSLALTRPDGARAFITCFGEDTIAIADLDDPDAEVKRVPVGPMVGAPGLPAYGPQSVALSPDGATVAIGNLIAKDVRFFDVAGAAMVPNRQLPTAGVPRAVAWSADGARLYVSTSTPDAIAIVDTTSEAASAIVNERSFSPDECQSPRGVTLHGEDRLFLACAGDSGARGKVLLLDASTLATIASTEVGLFPTALTRVGKGAP